MILLDKAVEVEKKFMELEKKLTDAYDTGNSNTIKKLARERSLLEEVYESAVHYQKLWKEMIDVDSILSQSDIDPEMKKMAQDEKTQLEKNIQEFETIFKFKLLPKDPLDLKNVLIEIRAGTGGEEAALFVNDLLKMYLKFAEKCKFKTEIISSNRTELGGFKEIIFSVEGKSVYSKFKFEGGVHRVQRVPRTEASGRIHTSASTVAVLPEPDEVDIGIDMNDLRIDVFRSQGPGGQSVNTTDSAVRVTHLPSGLVVSCQDEKSQLKNKNKALRVLRARLMELEEEKARKKLDSTRKSMVGSGDRSERIRTYNFPQNRITDHRIGLTIYALEEILEGHLDKVIEPLIIADQNEKIGAVDSK